MIKIIDTYSKKAFHEIFNICFLEIALELAKQYGENEVEYYLDETSEKNMKKIYIFKKEKKIIFKNIFVLENQGKIRSLFHQLISAIQNIRFMIFSKEKDILIYTINNSFSLLPIKLLKIFLKRNVIIICHGELENLEKERRKKLGLLNKCFAHFFVYSFKIFSNCSDIKYIVLGSNIKKKILEFDKNIFPKNLIVLDHPFFYELNKDYRIISRSSKEIKIGTIGTMNKFKGIDNLNELTEKFQSNKISKSINIIGKVNLKELKNLDYLNIPFANKFVERDFLLSEAKKLDLLLYLYPSKEYKFTASGAIFDAIMLEKPVVALKNDYFEYIFMKYPKIGYLCNTIEEVYETLLNLKLADLQENINYIREIKKEYSYELEAKKLKKQLEIL